MITMLHFPTRTPHFTSPTATYVVYIYIPSLQSAMRLFYTMAFALSLVMFAPSSCHVPASFRRQAATLTTTHT